MTEPNTTFSDGLLEPHADPYETYCLTIDRCYPKSDFTLRIELVHGAATVVDRKGYVSEVPGRQHQAGALVFFEQTQSIERDGQQPRKVKWLTHVGYCYESQIEGEEEHLKAMLLPLTEWVPAATLHAAKPATTANGLPRPAIVTNSTVSALKLKRKLDLRLLAPHAAVRGRQLVAAYAPPELVDAFWSDEEKRALAAARAWNARHSSYMEEQLAALTPPPIDETDADRMAEV